MQLLEVYSVKYQQNLTHFTGDKNKSSSFILSDDRSKASSKTIPPHSAI